MSVVYGLAFAIIKSIFPSPVILLIFQDGSGGQEGDLTLLASVYMGSGLLGGIMGGVLVGGGFLRGSLLRQPSTLSSMPRSSMGVGLALSLGFAVLIGVISTLFVFASYLAGLLPLGGVLDPVSLVRSSNFPPGTPLLIAWTFARDLLPAGLTGLFLAPLGTNTLLRLYYTKRPVPRRSPEDEEFF